MPGGLGPAWAGSMHITLPRFPVNRRVAAAAASLLILASAGVRAQQATPTAAAVASAPAPAADASQDPNVTRLAQFTVSDVPIEEQILPTVRPVDSVFGDAANVLDIPRSVSMVNKAWMDDRQVTNSMDFGQFSPAVYSPARYGVARDADCPRRQCPDLHQRAGDTLHDLEHPAELQRRRGHGRRQGARIGDLRTPERRGRRVRQFHDEGALLRP